MAALTCKCATSKFERCTFKPGDFVKFDNPNGSIGKVTGMVTYCEPFRNEGYFSVMLYFGKDVYGEYMTSFVHLGKPTEFIHIAEEEFNERANRKGWE